MARKAEDNYCTIWERRERPTGTVPLLAKILDQLPKLDGAACVGQPPQLFDADRLDQAALAARALEFCDACPALAACEQWAGSQRPGKLCGVVGGAWWLDPRAEAAAAN